MKINNLPKYIIIGLITAYQVIFSPDHGFLFKARYPNGFCRHFPSCSQYAKQAIWKYGLFRGCYLAIKRIIKCNPLAEPSVDSIN